MSTTSASNASGQFGDTTYTKVFVGGLAWETQNETLKTYFEQFGDLLEAVVIMDKYTGRSKGYGFVTFKEAEGARKACVDPAPVIDGRTANCNLASLGVQRSRPSTPQHGGGKSFRIKNSFQTGFQGGFPSAPTFPHYAIPHRPSTYNLYGYSPTSANYAYPMSYYNVYGGIGTTSQYPIHETGSSGTNIPTASTANANFYPYLNLGQSFGFHYPQYYFQYSTMDSSAPQQHYASSMSLIPTSPYPLNKV